MTHPHTAIRSAEELAKRFDNWGDDDVCLTEAEAKVIAAALRSTPSETREPDGWIIRYWETLVDQWVDYAEIVDRADAEAEVAKFNPEARAHTIPIFKGNAIVTLKARDTPPAAEAHPAPSADSERIYPCADCGVMRTKAEGGTTFTVCESCWTKIHPPAAALSTDTRANETETTRHAAFVSTGNGEDRED